MNSTDQLDQGQKDPAIVLPESAPVIAEEPVDESASDLIDHETPIADVKPDTVEEVQEQRKPHNFTVTQPWTNKTTIDENADTITLPGDFDLETYKKLEDAPNINMLDNPDARRWANGINEGMTYNTRDEGFVPTLEDPAADFQQGVIHNGTTLEGKQPKFKSIENQNLKGEKAVIRVMSYLGLGTLFQTPLWHTGIWLTFKAPTESELIELHRILIADKIRFGRDTYGLAFSNTTAYTVDRLINFALQHVYDSTLKSDLVGTINLKNIISTQDIPSILWGFVCTMYPRGFQYRRSCINNPEKCNFILEELLNLSKLLWVNNNAVTEWQKTHMSNRVSATKDMAAVERYKEELSKIQKKRVVFDEGGGHELFMTLKTPTINTYVEAGYRWISEITDLVEKTLAQDATTGDRNNFVQRHAKASAMRQYVHWVESIEIGNNIIDDVETIEKNFDILSSDNVIRNKFIEYVVDYINNSTIAVVGIPSYDCPACKDDQTPDSTFPNHKNIIPLDPIQLFFGLLSQRLERLAER